MSLDAPKLFGDIAAGILKERIAIDLVPTDDLIRQLDSRLLSGTLRTEFKKGSAELSPAAKVRVEKPGSAWVIDNGAIEYLIRNEPGALTVYKRPDSIGREQVADIITQVIDDRLNSGVPALPTPANTPGWAMVQLFGRLTELIADRLERVPEKHLLSFLDHAGIDLLPPKAAEVDLTFDLELSPNAPDESVLVPKDTRVATLATEASPEIIFETQQDVTIVPNRLQRCLTFDPMTYADRTNLATDVTVRSFRVFEGTDRRERVLYLTADKLLDFDDDASRLSTTIALDFTIASSAEWIADTQSMDRPLFGVHSSFADELDERRLPGALRAEFQNHGRLLTAAARIVVGEAGQRWVLDDTGAKFSSHFIIRKEHQALNVYPVDIKVRYWNGAEWRPIDVQCVDDTTQGLARSGTVTLSNRPLFRVDASHRASLDQAELSTALRAQFTANGQPLPADAKATVEAPGNAWWIASGGVKYLVRRENEALAVYHVPLMARTTVGEPQIADGFLFSIDARPYDDVDPSQFKEDVRAAVGEAARYHHVDLKAPLTLTAAGDASAPLWELKDSAGTTLHVVRVEQRLDVLLPQEPQVWLALEWTTLDEPQEFPAIASICATRTVSIDDQPTADDKALCAIPTGNAYIPLELAGEFFPLGPRPVQLNTFYLNSNEAFSKAGAKVWIDFDGLTGVDDDAQSDALNAVEVIWEYFSTDGWRRLGASRRSRYLFSVGSAYAGELDQRRVSTLSQEFEQNDYALVSKKPIVEVITSSSAWRIVDGQTNYVVRSQAETLRVYRLVPVLSSEDLPGFEDTTAAFTAPHLSEVDKPQVSFIVPRGDATKPPDCRPPAEASGVDAAPPCFQSTTVNDVTGFWIRARLVAGGYEVPAKIPPARLFRRTSDFQPAKFFAPLVKGLRVHYSFAPQCPEVSVQSTEVRCLSVVDGMLRIHTSALKSAFAFYPLSAKAEGPAMYLGWERRFPAATQIDLLMDAVEQDFELRSPLEWEYWSGRGWTALPVVDKSQNFTRRGQVSFTAPLDLRLAKDNLSTVATDHRISTEFGVNAFWFRVRPRAARYPIARSTATQVTFCADGESAIDCAKQTFLVILDASRSKSFDGQTINRYRWQLGPTPTRQTAQVSLSEEDKSIGPLIPVGDALFVEPKPRSTAVTVVLEPTERIWRKVSPLVWPDEIKRLTLSSIRLNYVKAVNSSTSTEIIIGSSDGERNQSFNLPGSPVLPDVQLAVRELDTPPAGELQTLRDELHSHDAGAEVLLSAPPGAVAGPGRWVRWHRVDSFRDSAATSRHFSLDPIAGKVRFGDGQHGRIPPVGRNNIRVLCYSTHNGLAGNVAPDLVSVLRNPQDALAPIRSVTNPERSVGASDAETVANVKLRGPQALKHRHQAITAEGFRWLAIESTSEIARAFAMPARNRRGQVEPGWVTVIIVPQSAAVAPVASLDRTSDNLVARPFPEPRLTRLVKEFLEQRAATSVFNNQANPISHIHVTGPEYVRIDVAARIIARSAPRFNANEVCKAVKARLSRFLHPVLGGPSRQGGEGWPFGRDVFLSEIYAEVEDVPGVDRVKNVTLRSSIDNLRAYIAQPVDEANVLRVPAGSIITTFDYRLRMALADPPVIERTPAQLGIPLFGFKESDLVELVDLHDGVVLEGLEIVGIDNAPEKEPATRTVTLRTGGEWPAGNGFTRMLQMSDGLRSRDGRLRLPLDEHWLEGIRGGLAVQPDIHGNIQLQVGWLRPDSDDICLWKEGLQEAVITSPVKKIRQPADRVFVPEGHLVYPGEIIVEPVVK